MATKTIPVHVRSRQRTASDPHLSAWVNANAGSGKTYVLAERVIRLLLDGNPPERILCLSYTKAAAAEMANRIIDRLSAMAIDDDETLIAKLKEITGNSKIIEAEMLAARRLFTRAIETPGGLKIQTIHAFCERILHRFPFEAAIPAQFKVMEERQHNKMLDEAWRLTTSETDKTTAAALDILTGFSSDFSLKQAVMTIMAELNDLNPDQVNKAIATSLNVKHKSSDLIKKLPPDKNTKSQLRQAIDVLLTGQISDNKQGFLLKTAISTTDFAQQAYIDIFFTKQQTAKKRLYTKSVATKFPEVAQLLDNEQQRLQRLLAAINAAQIAEATIALITLTKAIRDNYDGRKRENGLLNYDDLINYTLKLLSITNASAWIQYKLDQSIDHILIDEAQDTSPEQWRIFSKLAEDFFIAPVYDSNFQPLYGKYSAPRTIFVVGDEKQSIFSFQGADPRSFATMNKAMAIKAGQNNHKFVDINLNMSFRSTPDILAGVDKVFTSDDYRLSHEGPTVHEAIRAGDKSFIEIWPVFNNEQVNPDKAWDAPLDQANQKDAAIRLAERIGEKIVELLNSGIVLPATGNAITPGDIMVLLQRRKGNADNIIKVLKQANIPVAGSDRLLLTKHIAIKDLLALGEALISPIDDLALAVTLRSPLIDLDEQQLFNLCAERGELTLWQALASNAAFAPVYTRLINWRQASRDMRPFDFYSWLLETQGIKKAIFARLGLEAEDVLNEFLNLALNNEQELLTLEEFITTIKQDNYQITRDMDSRHNMVRVMTVHGAKGLEAPIVFLADSGKIPDHHHDSDILHLPDVKGNNVPLWRLPGVKLDQIDEALKHNRREQINEYNRLLYVAMTRAADYLYVCAARGTRELAPNCWYNMIKSALEDEATKIDWPEGYVLSWQQTNRSSKPSYASGSIKKIVPDNGNNDKISDQHKSDIPKWAITPMTKQPLLNYTTATVSALNFAKSPQVDSTPAIISQTGRSSSRSTDYGMAFHWLIASFVSAINNNKDNNKLLTRLIAQARQNWRLDSRLNSRLSSETKKLFRNKQVIDILSGHVMTEVPFTAHMRTKGGIKSVIDGRIDLLKFSDAAIDLIDFKTTAKPPLTIDECDQAIINQLAVYQAAIKHGYRHKKIRCHIIWSASATVISVPDTLLTAALNQLDLYL